MYISKEREKLFSTQNILAFKNFVGKSMSKNAQNQVKNKGQEASSKGRLISKGLFGVLNFFKKNERN